MQRCSALVRQGCDSNTTWHNVVCWNSLAKIATDYLKKGSQVSIIGRISNRTYEKDGAKRFITEIIATKLQMLDRKPNSDQPSEVQEDETPA